MSGIGKVVAVTGGSGYIASWLVRLLLERGYTVKASVRNLNDPKKIEHLVSIDGANERLELFEAELLKDGSFDSLVDGCDAVFHTASPVSFTVNDPQAELVEPAVKGTLNVLKSCAKVKSMKRVILTSSLVSVVFNPQVKEGDVVDESFFSDPLYCQEQKQWYALSKTLAEDAAWKFAKEQGIDMVAINPGYVIGPLFQPSPSLTSATFLDIVKGRVESFTESVCRFVDVRDVANAHILAFEVESASGRYCLVERSAYWSEALKILGQLYPTLPLPTKCHNDPIQTCSNYTISKKKAQGLGIQFIPLEVTLKDTVDSLIELNLLSH